MREDIKEKRAAVEAVRACKKVLRGFMSLDEIASALGVARQSLTAYGCDPEARNARAIPADRLHELEALKQRMLTQALRAAA